VSLIFPELEDHADEPKSTLLKIIREIPQTVGKAYDRILSKSKRREKAFKIVQILIAARHPPKLEQLNKLLSIDIGHESLYELSEDLIEKEVLEKHIRDCCGLFIRYAKVVFGRTRAYLIHQTAREWLFSTDLVDIDDLYDMVIWESSISIETAHFMMASSYAQLRLLQPNRRPSLADLFPGKWAGLQLGYHLGELGKKEHEFMEFAVGLCTRRSPRYMSAWQMIAPAPTALATNGKGDILCSLP
jgi:hypothetical protein